MNRPLNKIHREKIVENLSPIKKKKTPNQKDMDYILSDDENATPPREMKASPSR